MNKFWIKAITSHHKLNGLKQCKCLILKCWRFQIQNGSEEAEGNNSFTCFCSFQKLPPSLGSWLCIPPTTYYIITSPSLTLTLPPPSFSYKVLCPYVGLTWINQDNLLISRSLITYTKSFCHITYSRVQELRGGHLRGAIILPTTGK